MNNKKDYQMERFACTTMIVGKDATSDGSVIVAHSDDDVSDERVIYVPAADHKKGSQRAVYYDNASLGFNPDYNASELCRYIGTSRGPGYDTHEINPETKEEYAPSIPLGSIPQVPHTYAYFDSSYGIMNEHQLSIGECTCGAKEHPKPDPGNRLFYSAELSRVALERCTKASEAVDLMGDLIIKYGYYGTGETLLVGDTEEAWVMEMCGFENDDDEANAKPNGLWVAKRVPDNGYFVAANEFRIREIDVDDPYTKYSDNLFEICKKKGWWKPTSSEEKLDWLPTVSWGEYGHPYYSLRRVWRAMSKVKPSANFSPWVDDGYTTAYPFSIVPDQKLSIADVASIYRDHYEGTEFDLTQGLAAGPFGNPARYEKNPDQGNTFNLNEYQAKGAWERPLSIYRCGMSWINQSRSNMPDEMGGISWIGLDRPAATCLMPFFVGVTKLPKAMETMNLLDYNEDSAWWTFNFVANYATLKYCYMIEDIRLLQSQLEEEAFFAVEKLSIKSSRDELTTFCSDNSNKVLEQWWQLSRKLIVKYNDGCITTKDGAMQQVGYPNRKWLEEVGYYDGPVSY